MKNKIKKSILVLIFFISQHNFVTSQIYHNPIKTHGNLSVSGNKIVDQNKQPVSFAGNSFFWSNTNWGAEKFYNAEVVSWLKKDWETTIVRVAIGVDENGGYLTDTTNKDRIKVVIDAAIKEGLYVIIDWHSHHAEKHQKEAIEFFKEMATLYGHLPNIIYEIYNEPIRSSWSNDIKPYAEAVIAAIRIIDPDNLIIVGSSTWSQDVDIVSKDPITSNKNIAYTLHFYAASHKEKLREKAQIALDNGIALMVTEWGTINASGDGNVDHESTDKWIEFLLKNKISHLNWSVNDKNEGASIIKPNVSEKGNWSDTDLTESGKKVKTIIKHWNKQ